MNRRKLLAILIYLAIFSNARFFLNYTSGITSYLVATLILLPPLLIAKEAGELLGPVLGLRTNLDIAKNLALATAAALIALGLIEAFLQLSARSHEPEGPSGVLATLAMPTRWERRPAQIAGAHHAYYWHDILHVHNRDGMRRIGEFPPPRAGIFRIIVLGDSLTYGYGIASDDTYPALLEKELNTRFRVEVLNLGVSGAQSEDIHRILRQHLPVLRPDLVVYGVCVNDLLPSRVGEYQNNRAYPVPLPYKDHFADKTLTGRLLDRQYDGLLMKMGLRTDFLTDILRDFEGYQAGFARDVKAMNAFVREHGLPPIVAMVLDQYPNTQDTKYKVVLAAERHLGDAGIRVIPSDYIRRHDGARDWHVSPWEGHPNEKANRVFAEEILTVVRDLPELRKFRRWAVRPVPGAPGRPGARERGRLAVERAWGREWIP